MHLPIAILKLLLLIMLNQIAISKDKNYLDIAAIQSYVTHNNYVYINTQKFGLKIIPAKIILPINQMLTIENNFLKLLFSDSNISISATSVVVEPIATLYTKNQTTSLKFILEHKVNKQLNIKIFIGRRHAINIGVGIIYYIN